MSEPLYQLPVDRMRKVMQKVMREERFLTFREQESAKWENWKVSQVASLKRQRWIYGSVTATVLALIGFLLAGGCR